MSDWQIGDACAFPDVTFTPDEIKDTFSTGVIVTFDTHNRALVRAWKTGDTQWIPLDELRRDIP